MGEHHHHHQKGSNILVAFFLNAGFAIIELFGGYLTNSVAIFSDAIHDLGDSIALLIAYFGEKVSLRDPDHKYTYGYRRFSVLSAVISGVILFLGSIFVIKEGLERLANPQAVHAPGMIGFALLGIAVNSFAAFKLSKESGINQKMVMLHLFEDLLGWAAVFIVSIILLFKPWFILDSVLSLIISLVILRGVYKQFKKIGAILLQKFPDDIEIEVLKNHIKEIEPVLDVHAIQGWTLDGEINTLNFHVCIPSNTTMGEADKIKKKIKEYLEKEGIFYSSIEFESESYECLD
jgi:cobalt-zinc-cadmium efflux system protein